MTARRLALVVLALSGTSCGAMSDLPDGSDNACQALSAAQPLEGAGHVPDCYPVSYQSNPPSSGQHYQDWAAHGVYRAPLPRGFWVHNLEHGAIVLSYDCADGCPDEVAAAETFLEELPADPSCPGGQRVLLLPDPLLDVRWAASAWGFTLRAGCFDPHAFRRFYDEHYAKAPEDVCSEGVELRKADGTLTLPASCGE